jgi:tetratricopeptide (TPR) repeat protein
MLATTLTSYANVMGDKNEFREAKRALDLALRLKPQHRPAWSSMALVAFMTGDRGAALSWAQKVLSDQPDPNSGDPWEAAAAELMTPEGQKFAAEALGEPQSVGTWEKVQDQMRVIEGVCRCGTVDKSALIKDLVGLRMRHDPHSMWASTRAWYAESLSDFQLAGLPEATIVTIVETWAIGTRAGVPDAEIFARIEDHRSGPLPRGELPTPLNLTNYVKYRLALEYAHEGPIGELFVESAVKLAREAYGA